MKGESTQMTNKQTSRTDLLFCPACRTKLSDTIAPAKTIINDKMRNTRKVKFSFILYILTSKETFHVYTWFNAAAASYPEVHILVPGIRKQNTDPLPGSELNEISPPSSSMYALAIDNPRPVPS
jgi:hypothetical protein